MGVAKALKIIGELRGPPQYEFAGANAYRAQGGQRACFVGSVCENLQGRSRRTAAQQPVGRDSFCLELYIFSINLEPILGLKSGSQNRGLQCGCKYCSNKQPLVGAPISSSFLGPNLGPSAVSIFGPRFLKFGSYGACLVGSKFLTSRVVR